MALAISPGRAPGAEQRLLGDDLPGGGSTPSSPGPIDPSLRTRLTEQFGIRYPFVCAGMAFVAYPELVAAVSNAGGLGVLGIAPEPPPGLQAMIQQTRTLTDRPFGVDFINDTSSFGPMVTEAHLAICVAEQIPLVVFHWNVPPRAWVDLLHAGGAKVWFQTGDVDIALDAVELGFDGIIAQGKEAGGHVKSNVRRMHILRDIIDAVPPHVLVLAAGGIADGEDAASALQQGADGVWVGTRLVASVEGHAHPEYKQRVLSAGNRGTTITILFGPEWPGQPIRVLRNRVVDEWAGRENEIPDPPPPPAVIGHTIVIPQTAGGVPYDMPKFSAMLPIPPTTGDFEEMCMPAGESVKKIKDIKPAARIVEEMMAEASEIIAEDLAYQGQ